MIPTLHEQGILFHYETILVSDIHTFIVPFFSQNAPLAHIFFPAYLVPVHTHPIFGFIEFKY
jgi:hypothetical protein